MIALPAALAPLGAYPQFVLYKLKENPKKPGKMDKLPVMIETGQTPNKGEGGRKLWRTFAEVAIAAQRFGSNYGVGFSLAETDPFFFLDLDACNEGNGWNANATTMLQALQGCAVELSTSGRGLHVIGSGKLPDHACRDMRELGMELYHTDRFIALTGTGAMGNAAYQPSTDTLNWLVSQYFPADSAPKSANVTEGPVPEWRGPSDDAELIRRALLSQSGASVFGSTASFAELWDADEEALARVYPPDDSDVYDRSKADGALAQRLAFWTGRDAERIERLMRESALVREKWERDDYLPGTIARACARQIDVLQDKEVESPTVTVTLEVSSPEMRKVEGSTIVGPEDQIDFFKGCVYVTGAHRALVPGGRLLKPDQFKAYFGGYTFLMDNRNERTSRNAWECFTESQTFRAPRADTTTFRPDLEPGALVSVGGETKVNSWWPIQTPRMAGDATPFLAHLQKLIPHDRDRIILMSYMAACVQYQGFKFQWAPLIQGTPGNGKTLFTTCVMQAVGERYTHMPRAQEIGEKFNGWIFGKTFIGIEDIFVPEHQRDLLEILKPMITGERLERRTMQTDQDMSNVVANFMLNSNHKDAVRKTEDDRRYAVFYSAQQRAEDLKRDGMDGDYFPRLYDWLKFEGGFAIVTNLLHEFEIPHEFNPAGGCMRAPDTSTTYEAIQLGMGSIEQEIVEAIEREEIGFRDGWISSHFLDNLLQRIGKARSVPLNKRPALLASLGYAWHPGLERGRLNNAILPDGTKSKLYIHKDSPHVTLTGGAVIAEAYAKAQQ